MPHKCVKCGQVYEEDLPDVGTGCTCGSKVFLFVRNGKRAKHAERSEGKYVIDISALLGVTVGNRLVTVEQEGKYSIDLSGLRGR